MILNLHRKSTRIFRFTKCNSFFLNIECYTKTFEERNSNYPQVIISTGHHRPNHNIALSCFITISYIILTIYFKIFQYFVSLFLSSQSIHDNERKKLISGLDYELTAITIKKILLFAHNYCDISAVYIYITFNFSSAPIAFIK